MTLRGQMMEQPLLISSLIDYAAQQYGDVEIVSRCVEGPIHRTTYAETRRRSCRLAQALIGLGICLLYTSPSPRDGLLSRMPSSA